MLSAHSRPRATSSTRWPEPPRSTHVSHKRTALLVKMNVCFWEIDPPSKRSVMGAKEPVMVVANAQSPDDLRRTEWFKAAVSGATFSTACVMF